MKKYILIAAVASIFALNSCGDNNGLFSHLASFVSAENVAMTTTTELIKNRPDCVAVLKKVAKRFRDTYDENIFYKSDLLSDLEQLVIKSNVTSKAEILVAIDIIVNKCFDEEEIDVARYKQSLIEIVNGIEAAIRYYEMTTTGVVTTK